MPETTATASVTRRRVASVAIILAALVTASAFGAGAKGGAVDSAFGPDGEVSLDMPGKDRPSAMVRTTTGKIAVAIESNQETWIALLTDDGRLDPTFAGDGIKKMDLPAGTHIVGLAPVRGGGLLVAAWLRDFTSRPVRNERIVVAKVLANGQLDAGYGTGGLATAAPGELAPLELGWYRFAGMPDGSVVVLGTTGVAVDWVGGAGVAALMRFTPDGVRDEHFGLNGIAPIASPAAIPLIGGLAIAPDGGILVGETHYPSGSVHEEALLRRFTPSGLPDLNFGVAGIAHLPFPGDWKTVTDIVVDERGQIVVLGHAASGLIGLAANLLGGRHDGFSPGVARLHPDGRLDTTYGEGGITMLHTDGRGNPLSFSGDTALTTAGAYVTAYGERTPGLTTQLLRIGNDGRVDASYGGDSPIRLPMENTSAVVVLGNRVVVAGERSWQSGGTVLSAYWP